MSDTIDTKRDRTHLVMQIMHCAYELVDAMKLAGDDAEARGRAADCFGYAMHSLLASAPGAPWLVNSPTWQVHPAPNAAAPSVPCPDLRFTKGTK